MPFDEAQNPGGGGSGEPDFTNLVASVMMQIALMSEMEGYSKLDGTIAVADALLASLMIAAQNPKDDGRLLAELYEMLAGHVRAGTIISEKFFRGASDEGR